MSERREGRSQRLDKWLWFTRVAKTRSLAARLIAAGKARVNRVRASRPSQTVRPGDVVTLMIHGRVRILKVIDCGIRRGPAAEAATLYEDLSPARQPGKPEAPSAADPATRAKGSGRPTKRDRRRIDAWVSNHAHPAHDPDAP